MGEYFIRGNDRLEQLLADPARKARVDTLIEEMAQIDRAFKRESQGQGPQPMS